jgi:hypothetical protein
MDDLTRRVAGPPNGGLATFLSREQWLIQSSHTTSVLYITDDVALRVRTSDDVVSARSYIR